MTPIKFSLITVMCAGLALPALASKDDDGDRKGKWRQHFMAMEFKNFDANGDGQINKEDRKVSIGRNFKEFDADGDRHLNAQEAKTALQTMIDKRYTAAIEAADQEALATQLAAQKKTALANIDARVETMFGRMDRDQDQKLSKREVRGSGKMLKMVMKRFDENDDNAVTPEEFEAGKLKMAEHMKNHKGKRGWWGKKGDGETPQDSSNS